MPAPTIHNPRARSYSNGMNTSIHIAAGSGRSCPRRPDTVPPCRMKSPVPPAHTLWLPGPTPVPLRFQRVRPGTFRMGQRGKYHDEEPVHPVRITHEFYLGQLLDARRKDRRQLDDAPEES